MTHPAPRHATPYPVHDRSSIQTHAIILIVIGALCGAMIPMIFGIIALAQLDSDPDSARRMNRIGWIVCLIIASFGLLVILAMFLIPAIFGVALLPLLLGV